MSRTVVEVQGTWLANAGARQLLDATMRGLSRGNPQVKVALDARWGTRSARAAAGVTSIVPRTVRGSRPAEHAIGGITSLVPRTAEHVAAKRNLVLRRDIAALVDASGFALSDQWGARKARDRRAIVMDYARRGRPVVLLPQAMGPFEDPKTAQAARDVLLAADAVWVRDRTSLEHVAALIGDRASVRLGPDVTLVEYPEPPESSVAAVVLVPNARLVSHGAWRRDDYVHALVDAGVVAKELGRDVEVLLHTSEHDDIRLGEMASEALGCPMVKEPDARKLKGRLGAAEIVVASRFHAVLGALSLGVPAIAIGWSHKYGELFDDFGVPELASASDAATATALVKELCGDSADVRGRISRNGESLRTKVETMWAAVWGLLGWPVDVAVPQVIESIRSSATRAHSAVSGSTTI